MMKLKKTGLYRTAVQIISFIFLPVIYAVTLSDIKTLYLGVTKQTVSASVLLPAGLRVCLILFLTALFGRFFCGWICSFGAVGDWVHAIVGRIHKVRFRMPEEADQILKFVKYGFLIFLLVFLWRSNVPALESASPWGAFAAVFSLNGPDFSALMEYYAAGGVFLLVILIGSVFVERFFCRYVCPLGAVFALISNFKILFIKKEREHCGTCKACTNACAMGIPLYKTDKVMSGECIMCMKCTQICPRKNAALFIGNTKVNTAIAGTAAFAALTAVSYGSDVLAEEITGTADQDAVITEEVQGQYTDGVYTGTGSGFHGGTTSVSVTVENGNISNVEVLSYEDDKDFFDKAKSEVISEIIETQSPDVDAVSGATYSSRGIMEAVADALGTELSESTEETPAEDHSGGNGGAGRHKNH